MEEKIVREWTGRDLLIYMSNLLFWMLVKSSMRVGVSVWFRLYFVSTLPITPINGASSDEFLGLYSTTARGLYNMTFFSLGPRASQMSGCLSDRRGCVLEF